MELDEFLNQLNTHPEEIEFTDTISLIDKFYSYIPTSFRNGKQVNAFGQNEGSCKILAFAKLNNLPEDKTLHCFGKYYREEVLNNPDGEGHRNIRQFMKYGWDGVNFEQPALIKK